MPIDIRSYEGTPQYVKGMPTQARRDGVKKTLNGTVKTFKDLANKALNAADYEKTMHLPVGKGRLACDPETGDFDEDSPRKPYDPKDFGDYPMMLHSTITEGESIEVRSEEEKNLQISTKRWAIKPLEKKRRFTLTPEDQLLNLKGQVEAERAGRLEMERRLDQVLTQGSADGPEAATLMAKQLEEERDARKSLEARFEALMLKLATPAETATEGEEDKPQSRGRRTVAA